MILLLLWACRGCDTPDTGSDSPAPDTDSIPLSRSLEVRVTLDGLPSPDTTVLQGGNPARWVTDAAGEATITVDLTVHGDIAVLASHPEARVGGDILDEGDTGDGPFLIELVRFDRSDNPDYLFADPGRGAWADSSTGQCLHCHETLHEGWSASAHRTSASNPVLHDVYQGTAALSEAACADAGGAWGNVVEPGTGASVSGCVVASAARASPQDNCADCHAPGINGTLGGRDLLEATGFAHDDGVHCDVCHRIEAVDLSLAPGLGGALHLLRPIEPPQSLLLGPYQPLTFGPYDDVINPRMGAVARGVFHEATLCAGCHESGQTTAASARWPEGVLPVHSTYTEWTEGPMSPASPCQDCHMPPLPGVANSADLGHDTAETTGIAGGWERIPGEVRDHSFYGPRSSEALLAMAATVALEVNIGDTTEVTVTTTNVGAGHRIPTGEPLRQLLLVVEATCDGVAMPATAGDVLPGWAGALATQAASEDWTWWPDAEVGDQIVVVEQLGGFVDYLGFGVFGDGTFAAESKGLPSERAVGAAVVIAVEGGGTVTTDTPVPAGDTAYLLRGDALAGRAGWGFARVTSDGETLMVPHALATDIVADNRLAPQQSWVSTHVFAACDTPLVTASLWHRNYPWALALARGWALTDQLMDSETR